MIRVNVEEYCHQCLDFSPDVIRPERKYARCYNHDGVFIEQEILESRTDTIIQCEHRRRCAGIKRYLEQQAKGAVKHE